MSGLVLCDDLIFFSRIDGAARAARNTSASTCEP
jgi:hypothetical protein